MAKSKSSQKAAPPSSSIWSKLLWLAFVALLVTFVLEVTVPGKKDDRPLVIVMRRAGVWEPVDRTTQAILTELDKQVKNAPKYYQCVCDYLKPFGKLARDLGVIVQKGYYRLKDYVSYRASLIYQAAEENAPELVDALTKYYNIVKNFVVDTSTNFKTYLVEKVFVGEWSPENLQKHFWNGVQVCKDYVSYSVAYVGTTIRQYTEPQAKVNEKIPKKKN